MIISDAETIDKTTKAIGDRWLLDPPDGGDVKLWEGAERMAAHIKKLEADISIRWNMGGVLIQHVDGQVWAAVEYTMGAGKAITLSPNEAARLVGQSKEKIAEVDRLQKAMAFYAQWGVVDPKTDDAIREDGGDKARAVLQVSS